MNMDYSLAVIEDMMTEFVFFHWLKSRTRTDMREFARMNKNIFVCLCDSVLQEMKVFRLPFDSREAILARLKDALRYDFPPQVWKGLSVSEIQMLPPIFGEN